MYYIYIYICEFLECLYKFIYIRFILNRHNILFIKIMTLVVFYCLFCFSEEKMDLLRKIERWSNYLQWPYYTFKLCVFQILKFKLKINTLFRKRIAKLITHTSTRFLFFHNYTRLITILVWNKINRFSWLPYLEV